MRLAVCWKWVSIGHHAPGVGEPSSSDNRWAGVSAADEAALEVALRLAEGEPDTSTITVVCMGPPAADAALRDALAAGATHAVRIDASADAPGREVAAALAGVVAGSDVVVCGDYSVDRGTGSVPAFLAHELGAAQALGLVAVDREPDDPSAIRGIRRLDGGRREVLLARPPAVLSVEGAVARLRRASLGRVVESKSTPIEVIAEHHQAARGEPAIAAVVTPYRPRARVLSAPHGAVLDRVRGLLDVGGTASVSGELVTLAPADAARRIVEQLDAWGYLPEPARRDTATDSAAAVTGSGG